MTDQRRGAAWAPLKLLLYLLSLVYLAAIWVRGILYKAGFFEVNRAPVKVISVGNLTLGGTGKTPMVIALARIIKDELKKEAVVLIRGYGWDEQAMLKESLPDIPVLVGEDRVKSSRRSVKLYGAEAAILDDGFQYWELARDLNVVLVDSRNPFGNGHIFPRGTLREPKSAIRRADIVVFTKVDKASPALGPVKEELKGIKEDLLFLEAVHKPRHIQDNRTKKLYEPGFIRQKKVVLVSSIGDPLYFRETVSALGSEVVEHIIFGDHHNYRQKDMEKIVKICGTRQFDMIVTTEKDAVKLNRMRFSFANYTLMTLAIEMEIISGREELVGRLYSIYSSPAS